MYKFTFLNNYGKNRENVNIYSEPVFDKIDFFILL